MILKDRVIAFDKLKDILLQSNHKSLIDSIILEACDNNPWFTKSNIKYAFSALVHMLNSDCLNSFSSSYYFSNSKKKIGVIVPSNIPLVGFYDFFCVLLTGNIFIGQLSTSNKILLPFIARLLCDLNPGFKKLIFFKDYLVDIDMLIVTGNDNTAQYFDYHYKLIPKLIRKHRTSIGVINGREEMTDYVKLSEDIFRYFGLGCRNVSKLFIPRDFNLHNLQESFSQQKGVLSHSEYMDNYRYQKVFFQLNNISYIDFQNILLIESNKISSPISVLYYQYYDDISLLRNVFNKLGKSIQCVVSEDTMLVNSIHFGDAQKPTLYDFPDGIDVIKFVLEN